MPCIWLGFCKDDIFPWVLSNADSKTERRTYAEESLPSRLYSFFGPYCGNRKAKTLYIRHNIRSVKHLYLVWQRCLYNLLRKVLRGSHSLKLLRPPLPRSLQDFLSAIHIVVYGQLSVSPAKPSSLSL